ncbi:MAG: hypothetical protein CVT63_06030 [Candidatus Anoxymicrobium japonicum]|uniref:histidine kinase n=1 Tax=Candidatus Anoxymicrobium japonicum TaxID=2013648 RepID=A0A2N3G517_9ACTN|nr:MAG: hypothetical protein CVT63_06030 [Candidatus Anoxymicrobium japonicum]
MKKATVERIIVALFLIALAGVGGILMTFRVADSQKKNYFDQRKVQAAAAAAALDYADIEALKATSEDLNSDVYRYLHAQLRRIKQSDLRVRFVYLMRPVNKKMVFLVDAEDPSSRDFSPPGQVYEQALRDEFLVFEGKKKPVTVIEGPIHDSWGTWISTVAYVTDNAGKPIAFLGTDVDVERAFASIDRVRRLGIALSLLAVALMCVVAAQFIIWSYNRDKRELLRFEMERSVLHLNDELIKADRMKSDFIQLASHELRNPVNAVKIAVEMLGKNVSDKLSDDEKMLVQIAENGSARLVDLVGNLLDITRIESGDYAFNPSDVDVIELVSKTVQLLEPLADKKRIGLTTDLPDRKVEAKIDPRALLRVLENVVSNAIKFTDHGGVVIEVKTINDKLWFSVQDTGVGIPDSFKDKIFNRFSRCERSDDYRQQGAGIGLAISKSLVESQGGRIWFESEEGGGATFYFEIPRYQESSTV